MAQGRHICPAWVFRPLSQDCGSKSCLRGILKHQRVTVLPYSREPGAVGMGIHPVEREPTAWPVRPRPPKRAALGSNRHCDTQPEAAFQETTWVAGRGARTVR